jgi:hypothetical protein
LRERWFGATGRRVPEIAVDGALDVEGAPVAVRAGDAEAVRAALARPEVATVLVPAGREDLLELDLTSLTYES